MQFYMVDIKDALFPSIVLSTEIDELGINAGLQDRVIQAYEGCVFMNFDKDYMNEHKHGIYEKLDFKKLPKLYLAYKTDLSKVSGTVLNNIKQRYDSGDEKTISTLKEIANCAEQGKEAITNEDYKTLSELINKNFDLRCEIMNISDSNYELVNTARNCGASAKFSGSGGAIIGIYEDDDMLRKLIVELRKINARVIRPYIS